MNIEPTRTIPWIELAPDISGVWRVAGTFEITANPTRIARTKTVSAVSSASLIWSRRSCPGLRRLQQLPDGLAPDLAALGDGHGPGDLVGGIQIQGTVLDELEQQRRQVAGVELRRAD